MFRGKGRRREEPRDDGASMEASFDEIEMEERRSARVGINEDREDIAKERSNLRKKRRRKM